jgi:transcriptional regulator with XRE-family HTH domain
MTTDAQVADATIGRCVRIAREWAGMTQADLAGRLGWARTTVAAVEAGRRAVLARELVLLARTLGASVRELLGETQPR